MKISLIAQKGGWHTQELLREARKKKIRLDVIKLGGFEDYGKIEKKLGDVIIWFSSPLKALDKKNTLFNMMKKRIVMNPDCLRFPFLTRKFFQQKYLQRFSHLDCIPTFYFQNKDELLAAIPKSLVFPIIQKPNYGSQGDGISLLKSAKDIKRLKIDVSKYVYQNFITNDGDYRVFVIGGKVLGAIKRTACAGNYLNNVSKGGSAERVTNPEILKKLTRIALVATSIFDQPICGVDVIYDATSKKYRLMEINTNPEWKGFQSATGIIVAEKIIDYCISLYDRKKKETPALIKEYFDNNYDYLDGQKFHFASRMWLWTKDSSYFEKLKSLENSYTGKSSESQSAALTKALGIKFEWKNLIAGKLRKQYLEKYPQLFAYNNILFKNLFSRTIYKKDLSRTIEKIIPGKNLLLLKEKLEKDPTAIAALSTFAVNYFYTLAFYLNDPSIANPSLFLKIFKEKSKEMEKYPDLMAYMLTHSIIGESCFYSKKITRHKKTYGQMLVELEKLLMDNYFRLALDVKFEFLVCCEICNYSSSLKSLILAEADRSLADNGNFLISRLNDSQGFLTRNLLDAEHRNVLYIMATSKHRKFC